LKRITLIIPTLEKGKSPKHFDERKTKQLLMTWKYKNFLHLRYIPIFVDHRRPEHCKQTKFLYP